MKKCKQAENEAANQLEEEGMEPEALAEKKGSSKKMIAIGVVAVVGVSAVAGIAVASKTGRLPKLDCIRGGFSKAARAIAEKSTCGAVSTVFGRGGRQWLSCGGRDGLASLRDGRANCNAGLRHRALPHSSRWMEGVTAYYWIR